MYILQITPIKTEFSHPINNRIRKWKIQEPVHTHNIMSHHQIIQFRKISILFPFYFQC